MDGLDRLHILISPARNRLNLACATKTGACTTTTGVIRKVSDIGTKCYLIAMFNNRARIILLGATAKNRYRDWKVIHREDSPWDGEPLPDVSRWRVTVGQSVTKTAFNLANIGLGRFASAN